MAEKAGVHAKAQESKQKCSNFYNQKSGYNSSGSPADRILQLQRTAGNQAVQRLIKSRALQAKLRVGQPNDSYEQEADMVAEQVMRMPDPVLQRKCAKCNMDKKKVLQAKESTGQVPVTQGHEAPPIVHEVQQSPGQPLDKETRAFMEPRFNYDFSSVRVHSGVAAEQSTRDVNAHAYTAGNNIVFGASQFSPGTHEGRRLIAHELTHVVQQSISGPSIELRRLTKEEKHENLKSPKFAGNPKLEMAFDNDPPIKIGQSGEAIRLIQETLVADGFDMPASTNPDGEMDGIFGAETFEVIRQFQAVYKLNVDGIVGRQTMGKLDELSIIGPQPPCPIGIQSFASPDDISVPHRRKRVCQVKPPKKPKVKPPKRPKSPPIDLSKVGGILTPADNFTGRSLNRFGVGEVIDLNFSSLQSIPAADFGGLEWHKVSGGGELDLVTNIGTATYTAPATAGVVQLELRVASGPLAGPISSHSITIVIPTDVRMTEVPGTAPNFGGPGAPLIPAGTWGAGFMANVFVDPKDVSFQGVVFGEGTVTAVITPAGSFLSGILGPVHGVNTFGPGHAGNAATGTPVSPPPDGIVSGTLGPIHTILGVKICGASDYLWAIPWEFSVAGSPRTKFATANHHQTSTRFCNATIEKGGAGPFCRKINGTTC